MDVDDSLEQSLLQQFSCLGTTDKDELIKELQKLAGDKINASTASFFLDMNNWNLQAAVCSYFDFETPFKLPSMILVKDEMSETNNTLPPNTTFQKVWWVSNNGDESWPSGCCLQFTGGTLLSSAERVAVPPLPPTAVTQLSLTMTSPATPGIFQSKWRMITPTGSYFGDVIWLIVTVVDEDTNRLSDQLLHLNVLGAPPQPPHANTFSPTPTHLNFQDSVPKMQDNDNTMC